MLLDSIRAHERVDVRIAGTIPDCELFVAENSRLCAELGFTALLCLGVMNPIVFPLSAVPLRVGPLTGAR